MIFDGVTHILPNCEMQNLKIFLCIFFNHFYSHDWSHGYLFQFFLSHYSANFKTACFSHLCASNIQSINEEDQLHYAALRVNKTRRSGRHGEDGRNDCVYSSVKQ